MDLNEKYSVKRLYEMAETAELASLDGTTITVGGFVRTNRTFGDIGFLSVNDGSCFKNIQIVYKAGDEMALQAKLGSTVKATGVLKFTPENKQPFEVDTDHVELVGSVDESYPLQKKKTSFE